MYVYVYVFITRDVIDTSRGVRIQGCCCVVRVALEHCGHRRCAGEGVSAVRASSQSLSLHIIHLLVISGDDILTLLC